MHYFLAQENNRLVHLPDCRFEEGRREIREVNQIGGPPIFVQGRKQPDIFVFSVPTGASLTPCVIVDENALVRVVRVSHTEVGAHSYLAAGIVEDTYMAHPLEEAKAVIATALAKIK